MMRDSYGPKQYVAVEGKEKAMAFAKALMEAHECSVLIQRDDADIYIVSWANYYGSDYYEHFVWMDDDQYEAYQEWLWQREQANSASAD